MGSRWMIREDGKKVTKLRTGKPVKVTKTVRPKNLSPPMKAGVLSVVKRLLSRKAENHLVGTQVEANVLHNSAIGPADCRPLVPEISQINTVGANTSQCRIGDKITPKVLKVKGLLSLNYTGTPPVSRSDIYARVIIASQKDVKTGAQIGAGAVDTGTLLKAGFGATADQVPFNGHPQELMYDINKDKFHVYMDKVIKFTQVGETSVEANPRYSARWSYSFKKMPVTLTYDESNGDWCNNFAPFVCLGYAYSDGTPADVIGTKLISNIYSQFQFEDL